jgi:hypothetical protein
MITTPCGDLHSISRCNLPKHQFMRYVALAAGIENFCRRPVNIGDQATQLHQADQPRRGVKLTTIHTMTR